MNCPWCKKEVIIDEYMEHLRVCPNYKRRQLDRRSSIHHSNNPVSPFRMIETDYGEAILKLLPKDTQVYIEAFWIKREFRRKGYGQKLFRKVENFAKKIGAKWIKVNSFPGAIDFWHKMEFRLTEKVRPGIRPAMIKEVELSESYGNPHNSISTEVNSINTEVCQDVLKKFDETGQVYIMGFDYPISISRGIYRLLNARRIAEARKRGIPPIQFEFEDVLAILLGIS